MLRAGLIAERECGGERSDGGRATAAIRIAARRTAEVGDEKGVQLARIVGVQHDALEPLARDLLVRARSRSPRCQRIRPSDHHPCSFAARAPRNRAFERVAIALS